MTTDSVQPAMSVAIDLFKAGQKLAAALIYAELAQGGASSAELWCGLGAALLGCRGLLVRKPFEIWAAKVFRRGALSFVGTAYAEVVKDLSADLPEALGAAPLQDDEIPAMIAFLLVDERVLPDALATLEEGAAGVAVMRLGDRGSPLYVPLLRDAVEGKLGETTARSALERLGAFRDWPEVRSSLLVAKQAAGPAGMGPHLSSVVARLPAGWDGPHRAACPPYRGLGDVDIELLAPGADRDACIALLGEHVAAAPRDARAWLDFAPCMVKKGSPRGVALELKTALQALGASVEIHGYDESLAHMSGNSAAPPPEIGTYRRVFFEAKDVELIAEGDTARCALTTTNPAFRAFTDAVNARAHGTTPPDVQISKSEAPPEELDERWREYFFEDPLLYLAYQGPEGTAIVPSTAVESFANDLLSGWKGWRAEKQLVIDRLVRAQAIQARVDAQPRSVDWSAPDPAVLDALEARVQRFEALDPEEEATQPIREQVYLAAAGAGIFDEAERSLERWPRLHAWQRMAATLRAYIVETPTLMPKGATTILASHVGLDWFRLGPYVGTMITPHGMLTFHMKSWLEKDHTAASEYSVYSRDYSGTVKWRPGVCGVQQVCVTGKPVSEVKWTEQATVLAAVSTRTGHPLTGAQLGAHCAVESPDDWHAWTELGVALARLSLSPPAENPLRVAGGPLDRQGWASAGRACLSRAITFEPAMKHYSFYKELMAELRAAGLDQGESPVPFARLPAELLAHSGPVRVGKLSAALRADLLAFLDRRGIAFTSTDDGGTPPKDEDEEESDEEESEDDESEDEESDEEESDEEESEDESDEDDESSDDDESSEDESNDEGESAGARRSSPPPPAPGRTRPAMEALQFIVEQVRKEKKSNLVVGPFIIVLALFTATAFYVERESSGWAKTLFIWAVCAVAVAAGVAGFRKCLRPAEEEPEIVLLATRPEQVVWAHVEIVKKNGIHKATALKLYTEAGESLELPVPPTAEGAERALALMNELCPRATLGFSPESEALFAKDPAALRRP